MARSYAMHNRHVRLTFGQVASFVAEWKRLRLTDEDLQAAARKLIATIRAHV